MIWLTCFPMFVCLLTTVTVCLHKVKKKIHNHVEIIVVVSKLIRECAFFVNFVYCHQKITVLVDLASNANA